MVRNAEYAARVVLGMFVLALVILSPRAHARSFRVLYSFTGGTDGGYPNYGSPVIDARGNLYGTTALGGDFGNGAAYKLAPGGAETVLHSFAGAGDGSGPVTVVLNEQQDLYGGTCCGGIGGGVIFEVTLKGKEKLIHTFTGSPDDGCGPWGAMVADASGNLFGTTASCGKFDYGAVYKLAPNNTESLVYSFRGLNDGYDPVAALYIDAQGNLYGTTQYGGKLNGACDNDIRGCGTVFELTPHGTKTVLYEFRGPPNDGENAAGSLITDAAGNFYSILTFGGRAGCEGELGCGAVFKLTPDGKETILHFFKGGRSDGGNPSAGLIADSKGNLFGTTQFGGGNKACGGGCGTVFEIAPNGAETILHSFGNGSKGAIPIAGLTMDSKGHLFGTTSGGGTYGFGSVFEITP